MERVFFKRTDRKIEVLYVCKGCSEFKKRISGRSGTNVGRLELYGSNSGTSRPFFCGLLKQQFPSELEPEVSLPEMVPLEKRSVSPVPLALNPSLKVYKNIQLYSGITISGKNVVKINSEEDPSESLRAFYLNSGQLSHYEFRDRIIVFDWSGSKLKAILDVKVDSMFRPLSGREIILP